MYRRIISSCVLVGFVVAQWAVMPHGHALGSQLPPDHGTDPHTHLGADCSTSHENVHGHSHDAGHSHHHGDDRQHSQPAPSDSTEEQDHDSDAVYLNLETGTPAIAKDTLSLVSLHFTSMLTLAAAPLSLSTSDCSAKVIFADKCSPACPLYLALRTLRI